MALEKLGTPSSLYHVLKAFSVMKNLNCISFGVGEEWAPGLNGVEPERVPSAYDFFFRMISSVRLRYRLGDSLESQWWKDWGADYDVV